MASQNKSNINNKPLVVIEGLDGVGKTSFAKRFSEKIGGVYSYSISDRLQPISMEIDKGSTSTVRFFYYITSLIDLQEQIEKTLKTQPLVLDRYIDSTIIYHQSSGVPIDYINLEKLPLRVPDIVFVLSASDEDRKSRMIDRDYRSPRDNESLGSKGRVIANYYLDPCECFFPSKTHLIKNENIELALENALNIYTHILNKHTLNT